MVSSTVRVAVEHGYGSSIGRLARKKTLCNWTPVWNVKAIVVVAMP